ncbi:helix-turn-helix transcriptional regulator [Synoicihabitans lomoniglobus]|uniref:YafY family protein n=1 Tax=Synoicihabitans lomoniglobus TaxID=2909285 RepID=A0AAF0CIG4_9BACT|nr:YafY family transcriptional regulator [Opitutaceae bacterium LMO-M01]WED65372.1 YafY family protein [Opitutaceae bacterium LMO-M01]
MNRIDRLFAIALLLQSKRVITGAEIARHFEISLRTVYRDLGALSEAGIPVAAEAGVGYSLAKGYFLPPVAFTETEAQALSIGAMMVAKFGGADTGGSAAAALLKIQSIMPAEARERLIRLGRQVTVFGTHAVPGTEHLVVCAQTVADQRALRLHYRKPDGVRSQRVVEPLGVVLYQNYWYLVAWCRLRRDPRSFRLDRVEEMAPLTEHVPPRQNFRIETYLCTAFSETDTEVVRLWFSSPVVERALRELGPCLRSRDQGDDGWILETIVWGHAWIARWILSFGSEARVLDPPSLRAAVRDEIAALAAHYT